MSAPNSKEFLRQYNFAYAKAQSYNELIELLDEEIISNKIKTISENIKFKGLIDDEKIWHLTKIPKQN